MFNMQCHHITTYCYIYVQYLLLSHPTCVQVRNARLRLRSYSGVNADGCKATTQLDPAMFGTPSFQDVCRVLMGIQLEEGVLHPSAP